MMNFTEDVIKNLKLKNDLKQMIYEAGREIIDALQVSLTESGFTGEVEDKRTANNYGDLAFTLDYVNIIVTYEDIIRRLADPTLRIKPEDANKSNIKDALEYLVLQQIKVPSC